MSRSSLDESVPFEVHRVDEERTVVQLAEWVDHLRTAEWDRALLSVAESALFIVCDLGDTRDIDTPWIRLLIQLAASAGASGGAVRLVGMPDSGWKRADFIGGRRLLIRASDLEAAWADMRGGR